MSASGICWLSDRAVRDVNGAMKIPRILGGSCFDVPRISSASAGAGIKTRAPAASRSRFTRARHNALQVGLSSRYTRWFRASIMTPASRTQTSGSLDGSISIAAKESLHACLIPFTSVLVEPLLPRICRIVTFDYQRKRQQSPAVDVAVRIALDLGFDLDLAIEMHA